MNARLTLRLPVQTVIRNGTERWYAGRVAQGSLTINDEVTIWPSLETATVVGLRNAGTEVASVSPGESVSVLLDREVHLDRGDILVNPGEAKELPVSRAHLADLVWLSEQPLSLEKSYLLRVGPISVPVRCETVRYKLDLETLSQIPEHDLSTNEFARVEISVDRPILLDPYAFSRDTGGFILCDRLTGDTVAAGMSVHPLRRESDVVRHSFAVDRQQREQANGIRAGVLWLTGLPGSGKSTLADTAESMLFDMGIRCYVLDGDTVRQTLSEDLGFSAEDRAENVRRVAQVANLMLDAGIVVLVSLVSPFAADRDAARELFATSDFAEVFVDTPLEVCQERDPKGLYAKAAAGANTQMTGAGQTYEPPLHPELHLHGDEPMQKNAQELVNWVLQRRL